MCTHVKSLNKLETCAAAVSPSPAMSMVSRRKETRLSPLAVCRRPTQVSLIASRPYRSPSTTSPARLAASPKVQASLQDAVWPLAALPPLPFTVDNLI